MKRIRAMLMLMIPAAPKPCTTRAAVRVSSEFDSAHTRDAAVNKRRPIR